MTMPRKSPNGSPAGDVVRRKAAEVPAMTTERLADLRAAMDALADTSEIPETTGPAARVRRDARGRLPGRRRSPVRAAVLAELGRRGMTRYQLWRKAQGFCPTLPASAVYE